MVGLGNYRTCGDCLPYLSLTLRRTVSLKFVQTFILACCVFLWGCANRSSPAPVSNLSLGQTSSQQKININQGSYKVKPSETLYSIAFRANLDFRELAKINGISSPYTIYPGQLLQLSPAKQKNKKASKYPKKTVKSTVLQQKNNKNSKKGLDPKKQREYGQKQATKKQSSETVKGSNNIQWRWPVAGKITRTFSNKDNGYKGLYITNKAKTPVHAAASGTVVYAGDALRGYGHLIIVKHNDDYLSAYAHNAAILVKEKQEIKVGQKIAEMGNTESATTGLRFEIRFRGKSVNPAKYLPKH